MATTELTAAQLSQIYTTAPLSRINKYLEPLQEAMQEFEINTPLREAAFLAQLGHESGELRYMEEIASGAAYEGRKDLGNTELGDGKRFKGRGPIQITGRANYKKYGEMLGLDLIADPEMAADPNVTFRLAGAFWKDKKLNPLADKQEFKAITKRINGGYNGLVDREKYYARAKKALVAKPALIVGSGTWNPGTGEIKGEVVGKQGPQEPDNPQPVTAEEEAAKGVTTSDKPASETEGTPPPAPAAEVKASEVSLFTRLTSLSIPAGAMAVVGAIFNFVKNLPPYVWFALAGVVVTGMVIGYLIWRDSKRQAHERTLKVLDAAADPTKNNLRLV
jgi:predicted chitinase